VEKISDPGFQKQLMSCLNSCIRDANTEQSTAFSELQRNNQNNLIFWGGSEE